MDYASSDLVATFSEKKRLHILDLDGTLAEGQLSSRREVRARAERTGAVVFATARTPELTFSSDAFEASKLAGFTRPPPNVAQHAGSDKKYWIPLEQSFAHMGMLDPHATIGFGTGIWLRRGGRFYEDTTYPQASFGGASFREVALGLLNQIDNDGDIISHLAGIENPANYDLKRVDVSILPYRIQLDFKTLEEKKEAMRRFAALRSSNEDFVRQSALQIVMVDESNPDRPRYTLYIMPEWATKDAAVRHLFDKVYDEANVRADQCNVFYAGDTLTDVPAGLYGTPSANSTFMLVGGSRIHTALTDPRINDFAGEDLTTIKAKLKPTKRRGYFRHDNVTVIFADDAFPGTVGADSILAYMHEHNIG